MPLSAVVFEGDGGLFLLYNPFGAGMNALMDKLMNITCYSMLAVGEGKKRRRETIEGRRGPEGRGKGHF